VIETIFVPTNFNVMSTVMAYTIGRIDASEAVEFRVVLSVDQHRNIIRVNTDDFGFLASALRARGVVEIRTGKTPTGESKDQDDDK
jgi:hypothetical protein